MVHLLAAGIPGGILAGLKPTRARSGDENAWLFLAWASCALVLILALVIPYGPARCPGVQLVQGPRGAHLACVTAPR